jgi:hypothetical protein
MGAAATSGLPALEDLSTALINRCVALAQIATTAVGAKMTVTLKLGGRRLIGRI